jgi:PelA/Pel-15E family pectate lyase
MKAPRLTIFLITAMVLGALPVEREAAAQDVLISEQRIAELPENERMAWEAYLDRSAADARRDELFIRSELDSIGVSDFSPAPKRRLSLLRDAIEPAWFAGPEATRLADILLSYQTPTGGWAKNIDFEKRERRPGESFYSGGSWSYIGTFDNDATTEEMRFLAKTYAAQGGEHYRKGFERGLEFILRAQFPNGCWPQVYPLQGGYHDAATFNDEAIPNILELLRRIDGGEFDFLDSELIARASAAKDAGTACILMSQVIVDGVRTAWAQQYHPIDLVPVQARAYEHAALTAGESVEVLEFLMEIEDPSPTVVEAVHAAVDWLNEVAIYGYEYEHPRLTEREGAGPLWARFYELGSNRPIFSNRDGEILYDWHEVDEERRRGYAWYRYGPERVLEMYSGWSIRYPPRTSKH